VYQKAILASVCLALTACGDPLADFERLSDVPLAEDPTGAQIVTDEADTPPALFGGLFSRAPPDTAATESDSSTAGDTSLLVRSTADASEVIGQRAAIRAGGQRLCRQGHETGKRDRQVPKTRIRLSAL
jgi:hypothetical protein